jgi:hypothetical protein
MGILAKVQAHVYTHACFSAFVLWPRIIVVLTRDASSIHIHIQEGPFYRSDRNVHNTVMGTMPSMIPAVSIYIYIALYYVYMHAGEVYVLHTCDVHHALHDYCSEQNIALCHV